MSQFNVNETNQHVVQIHLKFHSNGAGGSHFSLSAVGLDDITFASTALLMSATRAMSTVRLLTDALKPLARGFTKNHWHGRAELTLEENNESYLGVTTTVFDTGRTSEGNAAYSILRKVEKLLIEQLVQSACQDDRWREESDPFLSKFGDAFLKAPEKLDSSDLEVGQWLNGKDGSNTALF